jgi:hypothetical protein
MTSSTNPQHLVLWDGKCGLCRRAIEWVMRRDTRKALVCETYQQSDHPLLDDTLRAACERGGPRDHGGWADFEGWASQLVRAARAGVSPHRLVFALTALHLVRRARLFCRGAQPAFFQPFDVSREKQTLSRGLSHLEAF